MFIMHIFWSVGRTFLFFQDWGFMGPPVLMALALLGLTSSSSALGMRMPAAVGECKTVYFIRHGQVCAAVFILLSVFLETSCNALVYIFA